MRQDGSALATWSFCGKGGDESCVRRTQEAVMTEADQVRFAVRDERGALIVPWQPLGQFMLPIPQPRPQDRPNPVQ